MPYDAVREMTLKEEIENLKVPQNVKERLLQKLKEEYSKMDEKLWIASNKQEERAAQDYEKFNRMREQNISLKSACFALAAALKQEYEL